MSEFNLTKGEAFNLTKRAPTLKRVRIGLGWEANTVFGKKPFDLDASAIIVGHDGKMINPPQGYVGYVVPDNVFQGISYGGDERNGSSSNEDEEWIDIQDISAIDTTKVGGIAIAVSIYAARQRGYTFGQVRNAYVRLVNLDTGVEEARINLTDASSKASAVIFGGFTFEQGDWVFKSVGEEIDGGLSGVCGKFGFNVAEEVDQ